MIINPEQVINAIIAIANPSGIIACKDDLDWNRLATNIDAVISIELTLTGKVIRVNRFPSTRL